MKIDVEIQGANEVIKLLAKVEPEYARDVRAELRSIGREIIQDAKTLIPESAMSGWTNTPPRRANSNRVRGGGFPPYDPAAMAAGMAVGPLFKRQRGSTRRHAITLKSGEAAAQIYERAGVRKYIKKPTGEQFVKNIERQNRRQLRLLGTAAYRNRDEAKEKITDLVVSSIKDINETLDRLGRQGRKQI